jgi:cytochrome c1
VLWDLSGTNKLVQNEFDSHEKAIAAAIAIKGLAKVEPGIGDKWFVRTVTADIPGTMTNAQYQAFVADLVNFMDYMAEPTKNQRISLGIVVMPALGVLFVLVHALKRAYWKDVH